MPAVYVNEGKGGAIQGGDNISVSPPVTQSNLYLVTGVTCMNGGVAAVTEPGQQWTFTYSPATAPVLGDEFTVQITDLIGTKQLGAGDVTGISPVFCFTYGNKEYVLAGPTVYCSEISQPTLWNDPNGVGNGFVTLTNWFATPEDLVAIAPFQGRLAFFSRQTTQIWQINADVALWQQSQVLQHTGTVNGATVQPIGELDVLYLSDTGIRSLKVRDTTLNAYVDDLGSPIDSDVVASMLATPAGVAAACSIVEPTSQQYWLVLNGVIYVLSRFLSSKVTAWSKFTPQYFADTNLATAPTAITISKFGIMAGKVYFRAGNDLFVYGGTGGTTYDQTTPIGVTPYLDFKSPGTKKDFNGLQVASSGTWVVEAGTDPQSGTLDSVATLATNTFDIGSIIWASRGTHLKLKFTGSASLSAAVFSAVLVSYQLAEEV